MLKAAPFANAVTTVSTAAFAICEIAAFIAPDLFWGIVNSMFHAINLEAVKATTPMSFGTFVLGLVLFAAYIWVITYGAVSLYNRWAK
jgi:hypothetical protein